MSAIPAQQAGLRRGGAPPGPHPGAGRPSNSTLDKFIQVAAKAPGVLEKILDGTLTDTDENGKAVKVPCSAADRTRAAQVITQQADLAAVIPAQLAAKVLDLFRNLHTILGPEFKLTPEQLHLVGLDMDRRMAGYRIE